VLLGIPLSLPVLLPVRNHPRLLSIGDRIPSGMLVSLTGDTVSLDTFMGKKLLLLFYSTSCPHCVRELENLSRIEPEFVDSLSFVVISTSNREATARSSGANGGIRNTFVDSERRYARLFGINAVPSIFLIGEDGRVCYRRVGEAPIAADRRLLSMFLAGEFRNVVPDSGRGKEFP
jgi:peroxiredoxin